MTQAGLMKILDRLTYGGPAAPGHLRVWSQFSTYYGSKDVSRLPLVIHELENRALPRPLQRQEFSNGIVHYSAYWGPRHYFDVWTNIAEHIAVLDEAIIVNSWQGRGPYVSGLVPAEPEPNDQLTLSL